MKVSALIRDFPIETGELTNSTPPAMRTFLFPGKTFVEFTKFIQGVFQRLGVLYFLTRAQGQVSVFHDQNLPQRFDLLLTVFWYLYDL